MNDIIVETRSTDATDRAAYILISPVDHLLTPACFDTPRLHRSPYCVEHHDAGIQSSGGSRCVNCSQFEPGPRSQNTKRVAIRCRRMAVPATSRDQVLNTQTFQGAMDNLEE